MISTHADVVGSLLRPAELLKAQEQLSAGTISAAQFKEIEDRAVDEAIALQESAGLEVVTDGETRRQSFQSQMTAAVSGFGEFTLDAFLWGDWYDGRGVHSNPRPANLGVVGKLVRKRYLSAHEFAYLREKTIRTPKITLPSPGLWVNFWSAKHSKGVYPTLDFFLADITAILREEVTEVARLGATLFNSTLPITVSCSIRKLEDFMRGKAGASTNGSLWESNWKGEKGTQTFFLTGKPLFAIDADTDAAPSSNFHR